MNELENLQQQNLLLKEQLKKCDTNCQYCKHHTETPPCSGLHVDYICDTCQDDCICRTCRDNSNWEWCGEVR